MELNDVLLAPWFDQSFRSGLIGSEDGELMLLATAELEISTSSEPGRVALATKTIRVPFRVSAGVSDYVRPIASEHVERWIRGPMSLRANARGFWVTLHGAPMPGEEPPTLAFRVELLDGRTTVARGHIRLPQSALDDWKLHPTPRRMFGGHWDGGLCAELAAPGRVGELRLRFVSDENIALRDFDCTLFWDGAFTVPMTRDVHSWRYQRSSDS
jgi:hypothetical protein